MPLSLFADATARAVRVALPVPIDNLFDYAVPASLAGEARPGCRVIVPFSGRVLTGVIVEAADPAAAAKRSTLAPIRSVVDPEPVLSAAMIAVLREAAAGALCPLGVALAAALPAGSAPRLVEELHLTPRGREALRSGAVRGTPRALLQALSAAGASRAQLTRRQAAAPAHLDGLLRDGLVVARSTTRTPSARAATQRTVRIRPGIDLDRACAESLRRAPRQAELLRRIAARGCPPLSELRDRDPRSPGLVRALADRGLVELFERATPRDVLGAPVARDALPELTPDQASAVEPICEAVRAGRSDRFLLHGVTGSGKTEVYLRAVAEALDRGRQALVLVPEITLTHQIVARLRARFGDGLAVLHSGLRPGERLEQWQRLRAGGTPIAVGARSALFAPLDDLGVIVLDEEHDAAYKSEDGFRYHARSLARLRAASAGCPVILGSATPSLETRYAADQGEIRRLPLPRRIAGRPLPSVEIVDLGRERARLPRGRKLILSRLLRRALEETLDEGGQAILLLNRRGFSTQILCFDCGHAERCTNCDVSMVYHTSDGMLRCHYCDRAVPPSEHCSGCGAPDTALLGIGTERLEEELRRAFPDARLARLDRDSTRRRGAAARVLRAMQERQLDVLIGTQMVAKGHDLPGVRLVGVVAADIGLHLPDFRAAERTFQLLTQVAGRAGRDATPGRVVIQTFVPDHYAIRPVREHDYERFYAEELSHRAALAYPPFGYLAQLTVSGPDEDAARGAAEKLARRLRELPAGAAAGVLGPAPAALSRLRGRYRFQILLKSRSEAQLLRAAAALDALAASLRRPLQGALDVAPTSVL